MQQPSPRPSRYGDSCPVCRHGSVMPRAHFLESDVNSSPTVESFQAPNRGVGMVFSGLTVFLMFVTWFGNLFWGEAQVAKGRAKVRSAKENILPRSPNAVICSNCYETLERE